MATKSTATICGSQISTVFSPDGSPVRSTALVLPPTSFSPSEAPENATVSTELIGVAADATSSPSIVAMKEFNWPGMSSNRSEEHTSELQSLMRISYAVFCLKKKQITNKNTES